VPSGGGSGRLEIVNRIGQRVRTIELAGVTPGPALVQWDGRNDARREVAPGLYTAWLIAGSTRVATRLVRVP
jgi:flagellar hook assembly protein FlgD